ncbi:MAG: hypothetical protein WBH04_15775 [Albidovulum sp.]
MQLSATNGDPLLPTATLCKRRILEKGRYSIRLDNVFNKGGPAATSGAYMMMWQIQLWLAALLSPQAINLVFAMLCLAAAFGAPGRVVMVISAALYVSLAFL